MLKYLILMGLFAAPSFVRAQDLEYKMELGGALGGSFYLGDANFTGLFKELSAVGGVVARYNLNPRMAVKGNFVAAGIAGTTNGSEYRVPGDADIEFSRTLYDLGAQFEYNFFPYGSGGGYKRLYRFTPYVFGGMGFTYAGKPVDNVFTLNFPIGLGVKYKIANRLNVGCELSFRFSMSDKLDVTEATSITLEDPFNIKSSGMKNKDSYSFFALFLTYDIMPKYRKCNN
ncbi:MAG: outer membrane beta-barrel protein [Bacteroidaceae bacterium]|nr:outer membrane beta-barrel protein [Bacteroidaceae bacterium]